MISDIYAVPLHPLPHFCGRGGLSWSGLRGVKLLGNGNNGDNAGSMYANGNNGVGDANVNWSAFLNKLLKGDEPSPLGKHIER